MKQTVDECHICSDKKRVRRNSTYFCKRCNRYYRTDPSGITVRKLKSLIIVMFLSVLIYGVLALGIALLPIDKNIIQITNFTLAMIFNAFLIYKFIKIDLYSKDDLAPPEKLDKPRFKNELNRIRLILIKRLPPLLLILIPIGYLYSYDGLSITVGFPLAIWFIAFGHSMYKIVKISKYLLRQKSS